MHENGKLPCPGSFHRIHVAYRGPGYFPITATNFRSAARSCALCRYLHVVLATSVMSLSVARLYSCCKLVYKPPSKSTVDMSTTLLPPSLPPLPATLDRSSQKSTHGHYHRVRRLLSIHIPDIAQNALPNLDKGHRSLGGGPMLSVPYS